MISLRSANSPRLIALTGYGQETDRRRALEAGFHEHLVKPIDLADLEKLLLGERDRLARFSRRE